MWHIWKQTQEEVWDSACHSQSVKRSESFPSSQHSSVFRHSKRTKCTVYFSLRKRRWGIVFNTRIHQQLNTTRNNQVYQNQQLNKNIQNILFTVQVKQVSSVPLQVSWRKKLSIKTKTASGCKYAYFCCKGSTWESMETASLLEPLVDSRGIAAAGFMCSPGGHLWSLKCKEKMLWKYLVTWAKLHFSCTEDTSVIAAASALCSSLHELYVLQRPAAFGCSVLF